MIRLELRQRWFHGFSPCMCFCPQSLKKKVEFLQKSLSTPTRTNEALSRLVFERCVCPSAHLSPPQAVICPCENINLLMRFLYPMFSPAPLELKHPRLHQPAGSEDIDLNVSYDISTPEDVAKRPTQVPSKKMRLDPPV